MKRISQKWLSFLLAVIMLFTMMPVNVLFAIISVSRYDSFIENLEVLEEYADTYATELGKDEGELVLNFIRTGVERYQDDSWSTIAGAEITGFTNYVKMMDEENGTTAMALRDIELFNLPNGNEVDFGHMFGTMNISYVAPGSADLSGWAGDLCDLLYYCARDTKVPSGTVDEMATYILEECFGADASEAFGWDDFYGDMDGYYLVNEYKKGKGPFSELMKNYFTADLTDVDRAVYFMNNRFGVEDSNEAVRKAIYESYYGNVAIKMLESDRGVASYNTLRKACCYALADYLYENAKGKLIPSQNNSTETDNDYYSVFSTTSSELAPGITQDIKYAQTVDGKQIVYYVATVDITRDDVMIMANYKDNDPEKGWGYQTVMDQAAALEKNYKNKYDNFNVIVATNADGYNMSTGEPGGLLVMDGKQWHAVDSDGYFAILKDGTAQIGTKADYEIYREQIKEAVGGFGAVLIKDGKINVTKNANYTSNRASRTAIGIKADGSVVMMVMDGRQLPFSAGGALEEIAQVMLDAGCVQAINLDGGGSTTYLSKPAGSDKLQLTNRPSDGSARSVATSLVAVSTAKASNEFDHAMITSDYNYITAGTSMKMQAIGVSETGNQAKIPENAIWRVSDENLASITADGELTALDYGKFTVELVVDGVVVGSKNLEVVIPDNLKFAENKITALYGVPLEIQLTAWYQGYPVAFNTETDVLLITNNENAGTLEGMTFTATDEYGIRSVMIGAMLWWDTEVVVYATINMYYVTETRFDFSNATFGNRTFAYNREITNAVTTDNMLYRIIDPNAPIVIDYTFAMDMTTIEIPSHMEPLKAMLPGADKEGVTAWDFMLGLAERVCEKTTVTITVNFSKDLIIDITNLKLVNDYFTLSSATLDENNNLTLVCNWISRSAAIDPSTANSLCMITGLKATVNPDAAYSNNEIQLNSNGYVSYDAYLAATKLYSFTTGATKEEAEKVYGLYAYEHSPSCRADGNDKGAHFSSTYTDFADYYSISGEYLQGWNEDSYYINNQPVTGQQFIPSRENKNQKCFYKFDENGVLIGTLSGLIEHEGKLYYAMNGIPQVRWASFTTAEGEIVYYYFSPKDYAAVDGVQIIDEGIKFTYTFENNILVKGDLRTHTHNGVTGIGYRWAGGWMQGQWFEYEGNSYYIKKYEQLVLTGVQYLNTDSHDVPHTGYYLFDENGVFLDDKPRIANDYYFENGMAYLYSARIVEVDGYYYMVNSDLKIVKNVQGRWVGEAVAKGYVTAGNYDFDANGRMTTALVKLDTQNSTTVDSCTINGRLVTIKNDKVCRVGYLVDGKYETAELIASDNGTYSFLLPKTVAQNSSFVVVIAGDVNGDGSISEADRDTLAAGLMPSGQLTALQKLAADINGNGEFNSADLMAISRSLLPTDHQLYQPLSW